MDGAVLAVLLGTMLVVAVAGVGRALLVRGRRESRARLLELLAFAVKRDLPIPRLLDAASLEARSRRAKEYRDLAARIEAGQPLAAALSAAGRLDPGPAALGAIAAVEGEEGLRPALEALADEEGFSSHRL